MGSGSVTRIPEWIKYKIPGGGNYVHVKGVLADAGLHTICVEARCPNIAGCFNCGTATFLALGDICTRNCRYCSVKKGSPLPPDPEEPEKIASAVSRLGLKYAVITSVTRDDLEDGGSSFFSSICSLIREKSSDTGIELLVPDFKGVMKKSLHTIAASGPDVLNHNIEVVKSRFHELRPLGNYDESLDLLKYSANLGLTTKSGLMIGFGETMEDIRDTMMDLADNGCSIVTVGQYLKSGKENYDVKKYYHPDEFSKIEEYAYEAGIKKIFSGPLVRSSYRAMDIYLDEKTGTSGKTVKSHS